MIWNIQFVKLKNRSGLVFLFLALSVIGAVAQPKVDVNLNIKGESLLLDTETRAPEPTVRMNPDPAYLELSFPNTVLGGKPVSKPIDKGLIRKVVTSQNNADAVVRIYVLSKPKATLAKTANGFRYNVRLNEMAGTPRPAAAKPATKPAATKPAATKPTATKPAATKPAATKPTATKPAVTKPAATKPAATKPAATKPAATKPVTTEPTQTRTVAAPVTSSPQMVREYFPFKTKSAEKAMKAAQLAFPNVSYVVDPVLNVLLVEGTPQDIQQLEKFLRAQSPK